MAPRALFLNKLSPLMAMVLLLGMLSFCLRLPPQINTVKAGVRAADPLLKRYAGVLFYRAKPYSGVVNAFYPDGGLFKTTTYVNGREEGWMYSWYPNHRIEQRRFFSAGKKEGVHRGWWPNGRLKFEYIFNDDEHNGPAREWYSNGRLYSSFHYTMGHEDGLQQLWWDDGSVRANYVVKNGQQYGLIGRKLCRNTLK